MMLRDRSSVRNGKFVSVFLGKGSLRKSARIWIVFLFGGVGYGLVEVIWRGYTHPSMLITGGGCLILICEVERLMRGRAILLQSAACAASVTTVEFFVGVVVNLLMHMNVWDYSEMRFHLLGQICAGYSFLWFLLCIPLLGVLRRVRGRGVFRDQDK